MKSIYVLPIIVLSNIIFAQSSRFEDTVLNRMAGDWVLKGTIAGQQTVHDISAAWILAHEYLQLHEISREQDSLGHPAYEALVFFGWDASLKEYDCLWLDITGGGGLTGQGIGRAPRSGYTIPFLFKGSDGSLFHTTFVYDMVSDTWQWLMDGDEQGKLVPFARVTLQRKM